MSLPTLSSQPRHYAGCCLSLSTTLIDTLCKYLLSVTRSGIVVSIGSGTGLLEALVNRDLDRLEDCELRVEGVEVKSRSDPPLDCYLPEELTNQVDGTWVVCPRVAVASALLFVYPRTVALVERYLALCSESGSGIDAVYWLGPKVDWPDFEKGFEVPGFDEVEIVENSGLVEYEFMTVLQRSPQ